MKLTNIALLAALATSTGAHLYAQGQTTPVTPATTGTGTIPSQGTTVSPGTLPSTGVTVNPAVTPTQVQGARNAQSAQQNSLQANPAQSPQQAGGGGVFGPSAGPGVFGPAGQTTTTDIYGNQQATQGNNTNTNVQAGTQRTIPGSGAVRQGSRAVQQARPGQATTPTATDLYGNPVPTDGQVQNQLPRDLQPLTTPSPAQPTQPASGTVTGR
ncbi:MAG: hypothetical protein EOP07_06275 [Proteobacteria bacterium]|nr:MAG: hypothetical protein EOP07_06275 [Pseudomonadota bacterium]